MSSKQNKALILHFFWAGWCAILTCYSLLLVVSTYHILDTDIFLFSFLFKSIFFTFSLVYFNHLLSNAITVWLPWSYHAWWAARASSNNKSQLQPFPIFSLPLGKNWQTHFVTFAAGWHLWGVFHVFTALTCITEKHKTIILIGAIIGIILATVYYIKLMNSGRYTWTHHHHQPNSLQTLCFIYMGSWVILLWMGNMHPLLAAQLLFSHSQIVSSDRQPEVTGEPKKHKKNIQYPKSVLYIRIGC